MLVLGEDCKMGDRLFVSHVSLARIFLISSFWKHEAQDV